MKKERSPDIPATRLILSVRVVVEKDSDGFHAFCPAFKGIHVYGASEDEAVSNALHAAQLYIDSLIRKGEPLPVGPHMMCRRF
jgi:predicted RNase H-like HicB family nuclease